MRLQPSSRCAGELAVATVAFLALALVATWPLARHLSASLPGDLGDPLLVTWVMAWVGRHLTALLGGHLGAFTDMWNAPIFWPERNALAYSEHFTAQAVQALPIYWMTGNPLLAYNVVFLATYVLSGVGAYAFVRQLTDSRLAGVVAGVIFAFNIYRALSISHLHTLSAQWLPMALWGFLVFARTRSATALLLGTAALVTLNLSNGYYLLYGDPLVAAFAAVAIVAHGRGRERAAWLSLAVAGLVTVAIQVPWVGPYLSMQQSLQFSRPRAEVELYSLGLEAYRTGLPHLVAILALACASVLACRSAMSSLRWAVVFFLAVGVLSMWLSLGPTPRLDGAPLGIPGLYGVLLDYVPGFSGLRVASRFAMLLFLALAVLAGIGAAALQRHSSTIGAAVVSLAMAAHLAIYSTLPMRLDAPLTVSNLAPAPAYLQPSTTTPHIYRLVATTPPSAIIVELPFGDPGYDLRYMFFSLAHGRPLLNGYSGVFPPWYQRRQALLRDPQRAPDEAWAALSPATHVVVHARGWEAGGPDIRGWLSGRGATLVAEHDAATLWRLP